MNINVINESLRQIADKQIEQYIDMVYEDFVFEMFKNGAIQAETERFYDQDAVFYGSNC